MGEGFDAQAGFVNRLRSKVVNGHFFNRLTHYGARGALLENLTVFFGPDRTWPYDDFGFRPGIEGFDQFDATFQLRGGWELNGHVQRDFVDFQDSHLSRATPSAAPTGPAYLPPDDFSGWTWAAKVTTPTWRQVRRDSSIRPGTGADLPGGHHRRGLAASTARWTCGPPRRCALALTGTVFRLDRLDGSEFARSTIPRLKVEYQPNRALFFRVIGEYRSERTAALVRSARPVRRSSLPACRSRRRSTTASGWTCSPPTSRRRGRSRSSATAARWRRDERVQLVGARAGERRVLREAGVSDQPVMRVSTWQPFQICYCL